MQPPIMQPHATWLGRKVVLGPSPYPFATWFGRVVLVGVALNVLLALAALFATRAFIEYAVGPYELVAPAYDPLVWPRFAALLLILLSLFYVPAAIDPRRYRASAWLAVLSRFAGALFFLPQGYVAFGLFDLGFGVVQGLLLALAVRAERAGALKTRP
jgi:hypothetical protein